MSMLSLYLSQLIPTNPAEQPVVAAELSSASIGAGSFLGGVVAGVVAALLVAGILYGCWKLKHSSGKGINVKSEEK